MLREMWLIMLISGIVLLATAVLLLFVLRIPELLDELSGRKAKRQIKRLRELNIGTGVLETIGTDDVYLSATSGFVFGEDLMSSGVFPVAVESTMEKVIKNHIVKIIDEQSSL